MVRELRTIREIEGMILDNVRRMPRCGELQAVQIERCRSDIGPNWRLRNFNPGGGAFSDVLSQLTNEARRLGRSFDVGENIRATHAPAPTQALIDGTFPATANL